MKSHLKENYHGGLDEVKETIVLVMKGLIFFTASTLAWYFNVLAVWMPYIVFTFSLLSFCHSIIIILYEDGLLHFIFHVLYNLFYFFFICGDESVISITNISNIINFGAIR